MGGNNSISKLALVWLLCSSAVPKVLDAGLVNNLANDCSVCVSGSFLRQVNQASDKLNGLESAPATLAPGDQAIDQGVVRKRRWRNSNRVLILGGPEALAL